MPSKARAMHSDADVTARLPMADSEAIARIARALGHPARIHIVRLLLAKPVRIGCDIVEDVGLAQSTVSEHLRILKAAGIVVGEVSRPRVCYSLNPASLRPLTVLLDAIVDKDVRGQLSGAICCPAEDAP